MNLGLLEEEAGGALRLHRLLHHFVGNALAAEVAAVTAEVETSVLAAAIRLNKAGDPRPLLAWQVHLWHVSEGARPRLDETAAGLCNTLGYHLQMTGDYVGARGYYERALAIRQAVLGEQHPDTAQSLNNLGVLAYYEGDKAAAQVYLARALAIYEVGLGEQHPDTQGTRQSLAVVRAEVAAAQAAAGG